MISLTKKLSLGPTSRLFFAILLASSFQFLAFPAPVSAAFVGVSQTGSSSPLSNGLVGYWTFDGKDTPWTSATAATTLDKSGNNNTGTLTNMNRATAPISGKIGQGLRFDGIDDSVRTPQGTGKNLNFSSYSAFTISGWVYRNDVATQGFMGTGAPYGANGTGFNLTYGYPTANQWSVNINNGSNQLFGVLGASTVTPAKTWTYVTFVFISTTVKFYKNGTWISDYDISSQGISNLGNADLIIGNYSNGASMPWDGSLDDVRVYNRALSAQEIQALYKLGSAKIATSQNVAAAASSAGSGLPNLSTGLVGYWTFDGKDVVNGVIQDKSGSGNNGNTVAISTSTFYTQGKIGQAGKFDGVDDCVNAGTGSNMNLTGAFSVGSWVNVGAVQEDRYESIVHKGLWRYYLGIDNNRKAEVWINNAVSLVGATALTADKWHHLVWVHNTSPDEDKIYVDGTTAVYGAVGNLVDPSSDPTAVMAIGSYGCGASNRFKGTLDDVRVYNRALSVQEIQELYSVGARTKMGTSRSLATSTTSTNSGLTDLTTGLVGYWTFDGKDTPWTSATAATTLDKSGNNNTATIYNTNRTTASVPGKTGQALNFDGVNALVEISSSTSLNTILTNHKLTYDAWVYYRGGSGKDIIGFRGYNPHWGYVLKISDGQPYITFQDAAGSWHTVGSGAYNIPTNKWFHLAMTYDAAASQLTFYVDGVPRTVSENSTTDAMNSVFRMGLSGWSNYDGILDNVHIYNRVLSAREIQQLYNTGR